MFEKCIRVFYYNEMQLNKLNSCTIFVNIFIDFINKFKNLLFDINLLYNAFSICYR